jgi:hypothetical protein
MAFTDYSDLQVQFPANYIQDRFNFPQEIGDQEIADRTTITSTC